MGDNKLASEAKQVVEIDKFLLCLMPNDFTLEIRDAPEKSWMTGFRILKKPHALQCQWGSIPDTKVSHGFLGNRAIREQGIFWQWGHGNRDPPPPGRPSEII